MTASIGVALLTGCTFLNPYDHLPLYESKKLNDVDKTPGQTNLILAGDAEAGLAAAEKMRQTYFNNLQTTSYARSISAGAASVLTGWALYNALQPGGSGVSASDAKSRRDLRLGGAGLATLYSLRQVFVDPSQESSHVRGYRAMTCLMLQSAPLLMTQTAPWSSSAAASTVLLDKPTSTPSLHNSQPMSAAASAASAAEARDTAALPLPYVDPPFGELDRLQIALDILERQILVLNRKLARMHAKLDAEKDGDPAVLPQRYIKDQLARSTTALIYARHALADGRALVATIQGAGRTITDHAGLIVAMVNQEVQLQQATGVQPDDLVKKAQSITQSIVGIGAHTATDEVTIGSAPAASASMSSTMSSNTSVPASAGIAQVANRFGLGWFASTVAVKTSESPPRRATKPSKPKAAALAAESPASSDELKALKDQIDAAGNAVTALQEKAQKAAAAAKRKKELARLQDTIDTLNADRAKQLFSCDSVAHPEDDCAVGLAEDTERLYAARRPVVMALNAFRQKARAARDTPECTALAALRVTPSDPVAAHPGDSVEYIVSQRDAGNPTAVFQGPMGDESNQAKFELKPLPGSTLFKASVQLGTEMGSQTIHIIVSDSNGAASQTLPIVVSGNAPRAAAPDEAASAPDEVKIPTKKTRKQA